MLHSRTLFDSERDAGPFWGRCAILIYIRNKSAKYSSKMPILADALANYMVNVETYSGKLNTKAASKFSKSTEVVLRLVKPVADSNRNITADNWYTSKELVNKLLKKNLSYVGTVKKE